MNDYHNKKWHNLFINGINYILLFMISAIAYWISSKDIILSPISPYFFYPVFISALFMGGFLLLGKIGSTIRELLPERRRATLLEIAVPIALVFVSLYQFRSFFAGNFPSTIDHTTQILRCHLTEFSLWEYGTFLPWTSAIGAGMPINDLYPPGGAMLYCLVRFLTGFLIDRETAYVATVFISWMILVGSMYGAGRLFFGKTSGFIAAGLMASVAGLSTQGGWVQTFYIGMWPTTLCCGFTLTALTVYAHMAGQGARKWPLFLLSIATGGAILSHPFSVPILLISIPVITFFHILLAVDKSCALWKSARSALFVLFGAGLSAWWLVPFIGSNDWMFPFGAFNQSSKALSGALINATFFQNSPPLVNALALVGIFWGLSTRRPVPVSLSVLALFFYFIDNNTWKHWFFSEWYTSLVMKVPFCRFRGITKILGFVLTGGMLRNPLMNLFPAIPAIWRFFSTDSKNPHSNSLIQTTIHAFGRIMIGILLLAAFYPFAQSAAVYYYDTYTHPAKYMMKGYPVDPPYTKNFEKVMWRLENIDSPSKEEGFFRPLSYPKIGVQTNILESSIPYRYGFGIVTPSYTPTMLLTTRSARPDPLTPKLSGMKYILALDGIAIKLSKQPSKRLLFRSANVYLFECLNYSEIPVQAAGAPEARITIETNEPDLLKIQLEGIPDKAWIRVGVSRYRKWRAFSNGTEVPIEEHYQKNDPVDIGKYISVLAPNGELELRYGPQLIDWIAYWLSAISGILLLLVIPVMKFRPFGQFRLLHSFGHWISSRCCYRYATIAYALFGISLVSIPVFNYLQPGSQATRFWYTGILRDLTSHAKTSPDGILDLGFGFVIGKEHEGKILQSITMKEIYPAPLESFHEWTTENGRLWNLVVFPIDKKDKLRITKKGPFQIRMESFHAVNISASNPHKGKCIPTGTKIELTLWFTNGEKAVYQCLLSPQCSY